MKFLRYGAVGAVVCAAATFTVPGEAGAMDDWVNGQPVFRSDYLRQEEKWEQQRESSRRPRKPFPALMQGGGRPPIAPEAPPIVDLTSSEAAGQIIIDSKRFRLLYTLPNGRAYEYPISVGREGFAWTGTEKITRIAAWPDWNPPAEMRQREPWLPKKMLGGVKNPLGAKALYLGNTLYRIHGTNDPRTIGRAASSGCFRMMNKHVLHLARLAGVGTTVRVVKSYGGAQTALR